MAVAARDIVQKLIDSSLPKEWKWVRLGDACETTSGGTPSRSVAKYYKGNIPWVKSGELDKGLILDTEENISEEAVQNSSAKIFPKGTLLIALYGATIGKLAFLGIDAATNQAICGIYENGNINSKFLYYFLFFKRPSLVKQGIGGAQPNISQTILKNLVLPVPSIQTQEAIVSKIEELFSELDKGIESLKVAQQQLKVYRQSVLKWAFEGKLTNENVKEGELPKGWKNFKVGDLSPKVTVGHVGPMKTQYVNSGIPFLRGQNVKTNKYDSTGLKYITQDFHEELKKSKISAGDILVVRSGNVGTTCVVPEVLVDANCSDLVIVKKPRDTNPYYISFYLNSVIESRILAQKVGVALSHFNTKSVENFEIPLATIGEQDQIVQELEDRFSITDKMEKSINQSLQQAEVMRQSVLKRAFEGNILKTK